MRKYFNAAIITTALLMTLAGCGQASATYSLEQNAMLKPASEQPLLQVRQAQTSVYRGVIDDFVVGDSGKTGWILRQAHGADYGSPTMIIMLDDSTKVLYDDSEQVGNGTYIEATYANLNADGTATAISVDTLMNPEMIVYNGTVQSVRKDKDGSGQILMKPLEDSGMDFAFNYSSDTVFTKPLDEISAGTQLSVLHSAASTRSLPPQSFAQDIREYAPSTKDAQLQPVLG